MNKILIPIDLSPVSVAAVKYAQKLKVFSNAELVFLHVTTEKNTNAAEKQVISFLDQLLNGEKYDLKVSGGDYRIEIGKVADLLKCDLIIMATHGNLGAQRVIGSYALKVISGTNVPTIVIQEGTEFKPIKNIAVTIDVEKESVQVIRNTIQIAKIFNAEVHLIGGQHDDERFISKVKTNMAVCIRQLQEAGIKAHHVFLQRKQFDDELIKFCSENDIDLLAASYYQQKLFAFSDRFVQKLLTNKLNLPIITLEAVSTTKSGQYSFLSI